MELKKVRKEKAISHAEEEEETEEKVENEENEEINVNETRGRYEELVDIGIGQRSIQGPSRPIHERFIGVTAASALKTTISRVKVAISVKENFRQEKKSELKLSNV